MHTIASVFGGKPHQRPTCDSPLAEWLNARGMSKRAFSEELSVTVKTVGYWCRNQVLPDLVNAFRIAEATGGGVLPEHWMGTDLAKFLYTHQKADLEKQAASKRKHNQREYIRRVKRGKAAGSP